MTIIDGDYILWFSQQKRVLGSKNRGSSFLPIKKMMPSSCRSTSLMVHQTNDFECFMVNPIKLNIWKRREKCIKIPCIANSTCLNHVVMSQNPGTRMVPKVIAGIAGCEYINPQSYGKFIGNKWPIPTSFTGTGPICELINLSSSIWLLVAVPTWRFPKIGIVYFMEKKLLKLGWFRGTPMT